VATTYEPIATQTLGSATSTITFSSIPATYTDLRVVLNHIPSTTFVGVGLRFNAITTNYSRTHIEGNGSAASSGRNTSQNRINLGAGNNPTTQPELYTVDVFSYTGSTFKTVLGERSGDGNGQGYVTRIVGLSQSTAAVTQIVLLSDNGNFDVGTTATLYGIKNA